MVARHWALFLLLLRHWRCSCDAQGCSSEEISRCNAMQVGGYGQRHCNKVDAFTFECDVLSAICPQPSTMNFEPNCDSTQDGEQCGVENSMAYTESSTGFTFRLGFYNATANLHYFKQPIATVVCNFGYKRQMNYGFSEDADKIKCTCEQPVTLFNTVMTAAQCHWEDARSKMTCVPEACRNSSALNPVSVFRANGSPCCFPPSVWVTSEGLPADAADPEGKCRVNITGCMDSTASNFYPMATVSDNSTCRYKAYDRDDCDGQHCKHGQCIDMFNAFRCACDDGYSGRLCNETGEGSTPACETCPVVSMSH
jgi:hypothetical protein